MIERLDYLLNKQPNLHCGNCYQIKSDTGLKPLCERQGCPIQHLAPIVSINKRCQNYLRYKQLNRNNAIQVLQEKTLRSTGLFDDLLNFFKAEDLYTEFFNSKSKSNGNNFRR